MTHPLPKSAQSVQNALEQKGVLDAHVMQLDASTRTAVEASQALQCQVGQIVKSLIFKTSTTHEPVLVLASGPTRVNEKVIAHHVGQPIEKADADFVRQVTGFAIGGVPPLGHMQTIPHIFIDVDLLSYEAVWAAAGTPNTVFRMESTALQSITEGTLINVENLPSC